MIKLLGSRSAVVALSPLLVVIEGFYLFSRGTPWAGEWRWTIDWAAGAPILVGPLLAAIVAFETLQWSGDGTRQLLGSCARRVVPGWQAAATGFIVAGAIHVIALAVCAAMTLYAGASIRGGALIALTSIVALAAAAFVGAAAASLLRNLLAVPLAAVVVYLLATFAGEVGLPPVFDTGGATGTLLGLDWRRSVVLRDLLVLMLLAVGLAAVVWSRERPAVGRLPIGVGVVALVAFMIVGVLSEQNHPERLMASAGPTRFHCATDRSVEVCLAKETDRQLPWLTREISAKAQKLRRINVDPPKRFEQVVPYTRTSKGAAPIVLELATMNAAQGSSREVAAILSRPSRCPQDSADEPPAPEVFEARDLLTAWINTDDPLRRLGGTATKDPVDTFLSLPESAQHAWVSRTYEQFRACQYERVTLPDGVSLANGARY
jgi:hypothetical protein